MKAIIKPGKYSHIHTCSNCCCVFSFTKQDCLLTINKGNSNLYYSIICPQCGKKDRTLISGLLDKE